MMDLILFSTTLDVISPRFFRLELSVLLGVCLFFAQHKRRMAILSKNLRLAHFAFVLTSAEIGAAGIRAAIDFCFGNAIFFETFRQPNLLSLSPNVMCWIAGLYAIIGSVFFITVTLLAPLNWKARKVYLLLVIPCTALYPVVMGNLTRTADVLRSSDFGSMGILLIFTILGGCGVAFYCLSSMSNAFLSGKNGIDALRRNRD